MSKFIYPLFIYVFLLGLASCDINEMQENLLGEKPNKQSLNIDVCKCLTERTDSKWSIQNKDECRDLISKEIGVENWEKINFSKNPELNKKWEVLTEKCTGSKNYKTGIKEIDDKNEILSKIGTSKGFIWEYIDVQNQVYTNIAFDGLIFRQSAYSMNGKTNSDEFVKLIDISGTWKVINSNKIEGIISSINKKVSWVFNNNFSSLTNNKGVVFNKIKVNGNSQTGTEFSPPDLSNNSNQLDEMNNSEMIQNKTTVNNFVINDPDGYTNVRSDKSSKSEILFVLYENQRFEVINDNGNWWKIKHENKYGYIHKSRVKKAY